MLPVAAGLRRGGALVAGSGCAPLAAWAAAAAGAAQRADAAAVAAAGAPSPPAAWGGAGGTACGARDGGWLDQQRRAEPGSASAGEHGGACGGGDHSPWAAAAHAGRGECSSSSGGGGGARGGRLAGGRLLHGWGGAAAGRALHTQAPHPGLPSFAAAAVASGGGGGGGARGVLTASELAPWPLPRYRRLRGADDPSKWKRMVVRIPPQVQVGFEEDSNTLVLTGSSGSTRVSLSHMDPTGLVAMQLWRTPAAAGTGAGDGKKQPAGGSGGGGAGAGAFGALLLLASPSKRYFRSIQTHIDNAVHGVMQGYLVGVTVKGVGYRLEPADSSDVIKLPPGAPPPKRRLYWEPGGEKFSVNYPHKQPSKVVRLKVGYTHSAIYKLPDGVVAFFVKPTLVYLYGVDKALVTGAAAALRAVRPPNAYTGNGVMLQGEEVKLRQRAGSK